MLLREAYVMHQRDVLAHIHAGLLVQAAHHAGLLLQIFADILQNMYTPFQHPH